MPSPTSHPPNRADWFAARALLATRRLRPFAPLGVLAFVVVFGAVFALRGPLADRAAATERARTRSRAAQRDTLALLAAARGARSELAVRDSAMQALSFRAEQRSAVPVLSAESQRTRDSLRALMNSIEGPLDRAAKAPLAASYRALAGSRALRTLAGVRALVDSLDALERMRLTLDPVATPQSIFAQLTQRTNSIGESLQEVARTRRAGLVREIVTIEASAAAAVPSPEVTEDTIIARVARDSARAAAVRADSSLREARQWLAMDAQRADSAAQARAERILGASPVAAAIAALVLAGVLVFTLAVSAEARRPTIAHAREAERLTGVPVHAVEVGARLLGEGRARLQPGTGIDPFRMVYLALTASGTRERTVCVTGDDADTVAVVAGRLAVSSAADERATLLVDLAPGVPAATKYFAERGEPGFTEAIAGVRLWREVARPVGASEGLGIDLVPAGARRQDTIESAALAANRDEFHVFAGEYDFTVIAAPTRDAIALATMLCPRPATVYVARVSQTTLSALILEVKALKSMDLNLYGILLVDRQGVKNS
ncbi:MAG: hypothetical protein ACYC3L_15505 [Gemmatimonadaceae bacterium]